MALMDTHCLMSFHVSWDHIMYGARTLWAVNGYLLIYVAHHRLLGSVCTGMRLIGCLRIRFTSVGREHSHIWRARVPLICFDIVELHLTDHVLRQFGYEQVIPAPIDTYVDLHRLDRRGKHMGDWVLRHVRYVVMWDMQAELIVTGTLTLVPSVLGDYIGWYYNITRLFVSPSFTLPTHHYQPSSLALHLTTRALQRIHQRATATVSDTHDVDMYGQVLTGNASLCSDVLGRVDYGHLIHMPPSQDMPSTSSTAASSSSQTQHERVVLQPRQRRRRRQQQQHLHDQDDQEDHENL